uniref:Uncharacterized protein n=1 Tax=Timema bartmani TaxID=61472 RepID=A0A7R9EUJ1_9NEOP|nr:unnamed protein product [Timema bartmani]
MCGTCGGLGGLHSGRILISENVSQEFSKNVAVSSDLSDLSANEVYSELESRGYLYKDQFRGILNAKVGEKGCVATVQWTGNWCSYIDSLIQLVLFSDGEDSQKLYLPLEIQQIIIDPTLQSGIKDIDVIYQNTTGIVRGGGVELRGLKTSPAQVLNNEYKIKLESVKFLSHTNPGLLADVKTVSYKNGEIKPPPNSNTLLIIAPISDLDKCGNFLDNRSIFVLARGSDKEIPKINHGLVLVMEQQFDGEKLLLLRKDTLYPQREPFSPTPACLLNAFLRWLRKHPPPFVSPWHEKLAPS